LLPVDGLNFPVSVMGYRLLVECQTTDITSCCGELRADFAVGSEELGGAATNVSRKRLSLSLARRKLRRVA
jgi:hypothetical protein